MQVRVGPLEVNFKAWNSRFSRKESQSTPYGNGIWQQGPNEPTLTTQVMQMDLNGTFYQNINDQPSSNGMGSVDLNGTIQQQPSDASSNNGSLEQHEDFSNFCGVSDDDMEKIQVTYKLL